MAFVNSSNKLVLLGPDTATKTIFTRLTGLDTVNALQCKKSATPLLEAEVWRIPESNKQNVLLSVQPHTIALCINASDASADSESNCAETYKKYMGELATLTMHSFPKIVPIIVCPQEDAVDKEQVTAFLAKLNELVATTENSERTEINFASAVYCPENTDGNQLLAGIISNNHHQTGLTSFGPHPDEPKTSFFAKSAVCAKQSPKTMLAAGIAAGIGAGLILTALSLGAIIALPLLVTFVAPIVIGAAIGFGLGYGQQLCGSCSSTPKPKTN